MSDIALNSLFSTSLLLPNLQATCAFGRLLALGVNQVNVEHENPVDYASGGLLPPFVIGFEGELGAGKTTLIRAFIHSFGIHGSIKSPTFTLVEPYHVPHFFATILNRRIDFDIFHFDLYRLHSPTQWHEMGFDEYITDRSLCLIEWPSKAPFLLNPHERLDCLITFTNSINASTVNLVSKANINSISFYSDTHSPTQLASGGNSDVAEGDKSIQVNIQALTVKGDHHLRAIIHNACV